MFIKNNKGFSLAEVLMGIAIISILVAISVPGIGKRMNRERLRREARDLAADLNVAKHFAISNNRRYMITVTLNSNPTLDTYNRYYDDGSSWVQDSKTFEKSLYDSVDISSPTTTFNIIFRPNSTAVFANQVICMQSLDSSSGSMQIKVSAITGNIELVSGCPGP
ncbi:MAG: prepilin-type N-terminal cleavage/methylation domain-containing protein [Thermodesulfobacteriota bacterium]